MSGDATSAPRADGRTAGRRRRLGRPLSPLPFQYWLYSKDGEIRRDESCVDYAGKDVIIFPCHGMKGNQEWKYDHKVSAPPVATSLFRSCTNFCTW